MSDRGDVHEVNLKSILAKLQVLRNSCEGIPHIDKSDPNLIWLQGAATMLQEAVEQLEKAAKSQAARYPLVGCANESREVLIANGYSEQQVRWNPFRFTRGELSIEIKGNLKSLGLSNILQILSMDQKTGILQFIGKGMRRALCLHRGKIIAASGNERLQLGRILSNKGLISQERLREALEKTRKSGRGLGEVLLALKYLSQETLRDIIRHQIQESLWELSRWKEGYFEFGHCQIELEDRALVGIHPVGMPATAQGPRSGEQKRKYSRIEVSWPVSILSTQGLIEGETKNISLTGALIHCQELANPDEALRLSMEISEYHYRIFAVAKMVRLDIGVRGEGNHSYALGVRFREMARRDLKILSSRILHSPTSLMRKRFEQRERSAAK